MSTTPTTASTATTMRAIQFQEYGGPKVLKAVDTRVPEPGPARSPSMSRTPA